MPTASLPPVRKRDPAGSRERLLKAGISLFSTHGPDGVSVKMIAKAARLNRRMVYHYYGNKEGLYVAVLKRVFQDMIKTEVELVNLVLPPEELMARMIRTYYEFLATHPELIRMLSWENLRRGRSAKAMDIQPLKQPILQALHIAMDRGRQEGLFREDVDEKQLLMSIMALSFFYFSNMHTLSHWLEMRLNTRQAIDDRVDHVVKLLMNGIRKTPQ